MAPARRKNQRSKPHEGRFEPVVMPLAARATPAENQVHLWYLDLDTLMGTLRAALDPESAGTAAQDTPAGHYRFARRFYLRLLLGAYLGLPGKSVTINRSVRGKPVLDHSVHADTLHFSMAKSGARLLIGLSTSSELGVDLEPAARRVRDPLNLARRYFSAVEADGLAGLPAGRRQEAFLRTWACKEAVVKASGQGIANQLCRFTVETHPEREPRMLAVEGDGPCDWSLALVDPEPGFLGAVAAPRGALDLSCFTLLPASVPGQ